MTQRGIIDPEYAVREGWVRDADNEISMDGYNAFIQITTSDGTSGFKVQNNAGSVAFSANSAGDGYVAKRLGININVPSSELDVVGTSKTDFLKVVDGAIDGYVLLCTNAEGLAVWSPLSAADGYSVFGNGRLYVISEEESSTTSENYQQKLRLTTNNLPNGEYLILWSCEVKAPEGNSKNTQVRLQLDDSVILEEAAVEENAEFAPFAGTVLYVLSGVHTIDMGWRRIGNSGTSYIRRARIILWRVV